MMRLFSMELKRILKTRITLIMIIVALVFSALLAWIPVTFRWVLSEEPNGQELALKGMDAIHWYEDHSVIEGELTPEIIAHAVEVRQDIYREYRSEFGENIPARVYYDKLWPYEDVSKCALEPMADENGFAPAFLEIDTDILSDYYGLLEPRLTRVLQWDNDDHPAAVEAGLKKFEKVSKPYTYYYGADRDNLDYEVLTIWLIVMICAFICSTIFSSDKQTGADDIQSCSKYGTVKLCMCKIVASLLICCVLFMACLTTFILLTKALFGSAGNNTSVQVLYSATSLFNGTIGKLQWHLALNSLLILCCTVTFTLLISSFCKKNANAVCISLFSVLFPLMSYMIIPESIEKWVQCFLPSGGIGTSNSVLYMITQYDFLNVGNISIWNVDALIWITIVEIPAFIVILLLRKRGVKTKI